MLWMMLGWILGIIVLLWLWLVIVSVIAQKPSERESPEEILRRRYASGEIETNEYEQRIAELRKTRSAA